MANILIHGLGQTGKSWEQTRINMKQQEMVHCPDLCQLLKDREVNYGELYAAFAAYCNQFEEPLNLCGLSLGAVLALNYAVEHPGKVSSLVLIAAQYKMPKGLLKFQNMIFYFMPEKMFVETGFGKQDFMTLSKTMMELDFSKKLDKIACPVLLVCGEKDKANRRAASKLHTLLKESSLRIMENASHEVNLEHPQKLAELLNDFWM